MTSEQPREVVWRLEQECIALRERAERAESRARAAEQALEETHASLSTLRAAAERLMAADPLDDEARYRAEQELAALLTQPPEAAGASLTALRAGVERVINTWVEPGDFDWRGELRSLLEDQ